MTIIGLDTETDFVYLVEKSNSKISSVHMFNTQQTTDNPEPSCLVDTPL